MTHIIFPLLSLYHTDAGAVPKGRPRAGFVLSSIDRPPLGDLAATMISLVVSNPEFHFHLDYLVDGQSFSFDTEEVRAVLGPVPLDSPEVVSWMKDYLEEGIESLHGGA